MDAKPPVKITVYPQGPLLVRGDFTLQTSENAEIDKGRKTVALCRCGLSALKPFCDGNHSLRRNPRNTS